MPLPFVVHAGWARWRHALHWENIAVLLILFALFPLGPRAKKLLVGVYPLGLVGLVYDSMRVIESVGLSADAIHLCDLRAHELALFGVMMNGRRVTFHDWFQAHPSPVLDVVCAIPYATFIFVCIGCAVWLFFRDYPRMVRFGWCFLILNILGFATYHVYPAAPPWYFHSHGCTVDLAAHASEGAALARVDALLGTGYFAGMYGRASDVFGAMPSLHCAYAFLVVLEGWATFNRAWRAAALGFFFWMCFSAVYLDHHWVLDALAGVAYCGATVALVRAVMRRRVPRTVDAVAALEEPVSGDMP
jgi:membrane-associated phospholipid phosphatase